MGGTGCAYGQHLPDDLGAAPRLSTGVTASMVATVYPCLLWQSPLTVVPIDIISDMHVLARHHQDVYLLILQCASTLVFFAVVPSPPQTLQSWQPWKTAGYVRHTYHVYMAGCTAAPSSRQSYLLIDFSFLRQASRSHFCWLHFPQNFEYAWLWWHSCKASICCTPGEGRRVSVPKGVNIADHNW